MHCRSIRKCSWGFQRSFQSPINILGFEHSYIPPMSNRGESRYLGKQRKPAQREALFARLIFYCQAFVNSKLLSPCYTDHCLRLTAVFPANILDFQRLCIVKNAKRLLCAHFQSHRKRFIRYSFVPYSRLRSSTYTIVIQTLYLHFPHTSLYRVHFVFLDV